MVTVTSVEKEIPLKDISYVLTFSYTKEPTNKGDQYTIEMEFGKQTPEEYFRITRVKYKFIDKIIDYYGGKFDVWQNLRAMILNELMNYETVGRLENMYEHGGPRVVSSYLFNQIHLMRIYLLNK